MVHSLRRPDFSRNPPINVADSMDEDKVTPEQLDRWIDELIAEYRRKREKRIAPWTRRGLNFDGTPINRPPDEEKEK